MYRRTRKYTAARLESMRSARDRTRSTGPAPAYPQPLPDLRMRITIERFDGAEPERHEFALHSTRRVDTYRVTVDGQPWATCGLSRVLEGLRKATPRRMSARAL